MSSHSPCNMFSSLGFSRNLIANHSVGSRKRFYGVLDEGHLTYGRVAGAQLLGPALGTPEDLIAREQSLAAAQLALLAERREFLRICAAMKTAPAPMTPGAAPAAPPSATAKVAATKAKAEMSTALAVSHAASALALNAASSLEVHENVCCTPSECPAGQTIALCSISWTQHLCYSCRFRSSYGSHY